MSQPPRWWWALAALVLAADQASKALAWRALQHPVRLGPLVLRLQTNTGAAFGLVPWANALLLVVTALACLGIIWYARRMNGGTARAGLGLILGGALGNLVDRLALGRVRDFVDLGFWPTFNLADAAISVGAAITLVTLWRAQDKRR